MDNDLKQSLAPIQSRLRMRTLIEYATAGLAVGAALSIGLSILRLFMDTNTVWMLIAGALALFTIGFAVVALFQKASMLATTKLIDRECKLENSTLTAYELALQKNHSPMAQMQRKLTLKRLQAVKPSEMIRISIPERWREALGLLVILCVLMFWPLGEPLPSNDSEAGKTNSTEISSSPVALPTVTRNLVEMTQKAHLEIDNANQPPVLGRRGEVERFFRPKQQDRPKP